jgi:2'-5' RNA ligase
MARLFVAVWPADRVVEELTALRRKDQRGVRFVPPDNWHLTLRFLGEADPDAVAAAIDAAVFPAATVMLGPAVDVLSDRALVVPALGLDELARVAAEHTAHLGDPPRKRFVGHLTLARVKPHSAMPTTLGASIHAEFDVHEVALVQSRLEPDGARYTTIGTWPTVRV